MDVIDTIKEQLAEHTVMLYIKGTPQFPQCGFSGQACAILKQCEVPFGSVNILEHPDIRAALKTYSNWPTFPQLYINAELVGGSDIMLEMFESGELQDLLKTAIN